VTFGIAIHSFRNNWRINLLEEVDEKQNFPTIVTLGSRGGKEEGKGIF